MAVRAVPMFRRPCRPTPHHRRPSLRHCRPPQLSTALLVRGAPPKPRPGAIAPTTGGVESVYPDGVPKRLRRALRHPIGWPASAVEPPRLLRGLSPACHVCNPDASRSRLHWPPGWLRKCRQAPNLQGGRPSPVPPSCRHSHDNHPANRLAYTMRQPHIGRRCPCTRPDGRVRGGPRPHRRIRGGERVDTGDHGR